MFYGFFAFLLFINLSPRLTLYRHIVAVKKFRRFQVEAGRRYKVTAEITSATPRRMINNFCDPKTNE